MKITYRKMPPAIPERRTGDRPIAGVDPQSIGARLDRLIRADAAGDPAATRALAAAVRRAAKASITAFDDIADLTERQLRYLVGALLDFGIIVRRKGPLSRKVTELVRADFEAATKAIVTQLKRCFPHVDQERAKAGCDKRPEPCPNVPHFHEPSKRHPRRYGGFIPRTVKAVRTMIDHARRAEERERRARLT